MRAKEHWVNLDNLSTESFMLTHWMQAHGLQMVPPKYTFKIMGVYKDCLSKQVAEAIQIEHKGILNKRSEFGINHIPRLVADKSDQERDKLLEQEARDRANLLSNLHCFKNVVMNVKESMRIIKNSSCSRSNKSSKRQSRGEGPAAIETGNRKGKKRRLDMFSSTPIWEHRGISGEQETPESTVETPPILDFSGGSFEMECTVDKAYSEPVGLSPALKKLLIRPREGEEYMDTRKLLRETLNLTRAVMWNGLIEENLNADEFKLNLLDNAFFKKYGIAEVDTMEELLKGLKIDDWEDNDFRNLLTLNQIPDPIRRRGILVIDTPTLVE